MHSIRTRSQKRTPKLRLIASEDPHPSLFYDASLVPFSCLIRDLTVRKSPVKGKRSTYNKETPPRTTPKNRHLPSDKATEREPEGKPLAHAYQHWERRTLLGKQPRVVPQLHTHFKQEKLPPPLKKAQSRETIKGSLQKWYGRPEVWSAGGFLLSKLVADCT
jgi:hypothetical protein